MIFIWLNNSEGFEFKYIFIGFLVQKSLFHSGFAAGVGISPCIFCTEQIVFERKEQKKMTNSDPKISL